MGILCPEKDVDSYVWRSIYSDDYVHDVGMGIMEWFTKDVSGLIVEMDYCCGLMEGEMWKGIIACSVLKIKDWSILVPYPKHESILVPIYQQPEENAIVNKAFFGFCPMVLHFPWLIE